MSVSAWPVFTNFENKLKVAMPSAWSNLVGGVSNTTFMTTGQADSKWHRLLVASIILLPAMLMVTSCVCRHVQIPSPVKMPKMPKTFSQEGVAVPADRWWQSFEDAKLNSLIDKALKNNFSLRSVWDRLDQSRAVAAKKGAPLGPSVEGSVGASRTVRKTSGASKVYSTEYSFGLAISYEVDLWGRVRSRHDAALLDLKATREDIQAAAITLTAEVAKTWYRLVEQRGQLRLLDEQITTNGKFLEVVALKFRRGQNSVTDVLQQKQLVESKKGERVLVESNISVLEHALAVLLGRAPGEAIAEASQALPQLAPLPQAGLPAQCLRRRPDVKSAELRVRAADQRVGAAIADQFPRLGLTVGAETTTERVRDLFDNWMASLAANLVAPVFDRDERRAEVERARAVLSEQLNLYGQVVLNSLKEVEDALSQETRQGQYVARLKEQLTLAGKSTEQTLANYTKGTMDFTRYLTTLLSYQNLQRTYLHSQLDFVLYRIDLYRAIAGSWKLPRPQRAKPPDR
ncbi:MAG: TolC family protein [Planctomycetes bacterium]|nr:TolC family protein [Planctomycetota bacterium]